MHFYSESYRIRRDHETGLYVPESRFILFGFRSRWKSWHQPVPCDDEIFEFDGIQEAIAFLEQETGKARRFLDIQYIGI